MQVELWVSSKYTSKHSADFFIQVEFASPKELLQKKDGHFRAMVEQANDKEALLAMVMHWSSTVYIIEI